jgi:hypothetical protein
MMAEEKKKKEMALLRSLRSKINAKAYHAAAVGGGGRSLDLLFASMDADGSGSLSIEELLAAIRRIMTISEDEAALITRRFVREARSDGQDAGSGGPAAGADAAAGAEIDYDHFLKFLDVGEGFFDQPAYRICPELSEAAEARARDRDGPQFGRLFARAMAAYEKRPRTRDTQSRAAALFTKAIERGEAELKEKRRLQKRLQKRRRGPHGGAGFAASECALGDLTRLGDAYYNRGQCLGYVGDQKRAMKDFAQARKTSAKIAEHQEVSMGVDTGPASLLTEEKKREEDAGGAGTAGPSAAAAAMLAMWG